ncbi:MAG: hypothetical protein AAFV77_00680 [Planctomycetota bacterium]
MGVIACVRTKLGTLAAGGLLMALFSGLSVATLLGCMATDEFGPWFSLFPLFAFGVAGSAIAAFLMLVIAIVIWMKQSKQTSPRRLADTTILIQMLVLLAQIGVVFWMFSEFVPTV